VKTEKTSLSRIPWTDDAVAGTVLPFRLRLFYSKMKTETLTITFSKKFANSAREVAYLFADEKEDLGKTIENMCDSYFEQLVKNDGCELNYEIEDRFWKSESQCRTAAGRLARKVSTFYALVPRPETKGRWGIAVIPHNQLCDSNGCACRDAHQGSMA
jgi:hypothetical protein